MREPEEFWDELFAQIEAGKIIPVVGPELLAVSVAGRETHLYQVLAERLLAKYGLAAGGGRQRTAPLRMLKRSCCARTMSSTMPCALWWPNADVACRTFTARSTTC